jgi:thiol:disulfide interchange protein DsbD
VSVGFIWLAASAGALSVLTPCVFPMVPITVSYFTGRGNVSRAARLRQTLLFGVGIVATFTALGLVLAVFVGATAAALLAANPWVNVALSILFVAFALNLFGVYETALPSAWLTALDGAVRNSQRPGSLLSVGSALLTGAVFTLTSFTCTAPFVGTVLVTAAQGSWRMPLVGMLVYSTVFALPFCLLAVVPQWIARLPRAGEWLHRLKVVMGFVELAAAVKFLANADLVWHWNIFTREVVLASWVGLGVVTAAYLWGVFPGAYTGTHTGTRDSRERGAGRLAAGAIALAIGGWLATGLAGHTLGELESFLPPPNTRATSLARASGGSVPVALDWQINDYAGSLKKAQFAGKRVFIDFTGYTCTNCRWMEGNMFSRPEVKVALAQFELSRLFTDGEGEVYEHQQAFQQSQFNTVALPLYAVVDATGQTVTTFAGLTRDPVVFLAFLKRGLGAG